MDRTSASDAESREFESHRVYQIPTKVVPNIYKGCTKYLQRLYKIYTKAVPNIYKGAKP